MSTEIKATPGPWWLDCTSDPDYIFANDGMVAEIRGNGADLPRLANARLIAAAPEMLEALELLIAQGAFPTEAYEKALAMIRKVRGGE